jgi:hypothetical protein
MEQWWDDDWEEKTEELQEKLAPVSLRLRRLTLVLLWTVLLRKCHSYADYLSQLLT